MVIMDSRNHLPATLLIVYNRLVICITSRFQQKELRANPGEMHHMTIDAAGLTGDVLTVEVLKEA